MQQSSTTSRRTMLFRGGAALLAGPAVLLAACAAPGGSGDTAASPPTADLKGVTVEFWPKDAAGHPEYEATKKILDAFNQNNTYGITVTVAGQSSSSATGDMKKVVAALAAGTPPDFINQHGYNLADLFRKSVLIDFDAELKSNNDYKKVRAGIYPHILAGHTLQNKLFSLPTHNSFFEMFYQSDLLKRAGLTAPPPRTWTWDDFVSYSKQAAHPPDVTGYDEQWSYARTGMMILNNGVQMVSADNTKLQLTAPEVLATIEWALNYEKAGLSHSFDASAKGGGYAERLSDGQVVFQFGVPARVVTYQKSNVPFGVCFYPLGPSNKEKANYSHGASYGMGVFKNSAKPKQASAAALASLAATQLDSGLIYAKEAGTPPSYKYVVDAPALQDYLKSNPESAVFYQGLPSFLPFPPVPSFEDVRAEIDKHLVDIWSGKTSARDGLAEAQRAGQQIMDAAQKG